LASLPSLQLEVAALALVPIVERVIERQHATIHKHIAGRHCGGPYVSCAHRLGETEATIRQSQHKYNQFLECIEDARRPLNVLQEFGFGKHPQLLEAIQGDRPTEEKNYHPQSGGCRHKSLDPASQFWLHAEARRMNKAAKVGIARLAAGLLPHERRRLELDAIVDHATISYFRNQAHTVQIFALPTTVVVALLQDRLVSQFYQTMPYVVLPAEGGQCVLEADFEEVF
jgi:hypothetical protein